MRANGTSALRRCVSSASGPFVLLSLVNYSEKPEVTLTHLASPTDSFPKKDLRMVGSNSCFSTCDVIVSLFSSIFACVCMRLEPKTTQER